MDIAEAQLKIECERIGSMGQVRVMAQLGDQLLHIDKGDLADSAFRDRFANTSSLVLDSIMSASL